MIPSSEFELGRVYKDDSGRYAIIRRNITEPIGSDVVIPHNLGFVPKQAFVVSSEGKAIDCYFKVTSGAVVKDTLKMILRFTATNTICTLRIE